MKISKKTILKGVTLAAVFAMMCVLRLWFTMIILFSFGFLLTLLTRRRSFCSDHCPMGTIQDAAYSRRAPRNPAFHRVLKSQALQRSVSVLFWGAVVLSIYFFFDAPNRLWAAMFSIMTGSALTAVILQALTRKRAWCSTVCPYGKVLDRTMKQMHTKPDPKV